jgi:hypothetical protein
MPIDYVRTKRGRILDLGSRTGDTNAASNSKGQFVLSGANGAVAGSFQDDQVTFSQIKVNGRPIKLGSRAGGTGVDINESGEFVISGPGGTYAGKVHQESVDGGLVRDSQGSVLDLGSSKGKMDVDIDENGRYVIAGALGCATGKATRGDKLTQDGKPLVVGSLSGYVSLALNGSGQFVIAGARGLVVGELDGQAQKLSGIDTDNNFSEPGLALNDQGQFLVSGSRGTVSGKIDEGRVVTAAIREASGKELDVGGPSGGPGVALNNSGQFVVAGDGGTFTGNLTQDAVAKPVLDRFGQAKPLDVGSPRGRTRADINGAGHFVVVGAKGIVAGADNRGELLKDQFHATMDVASHRERPGLKLDESGRFLAAGSLATVIGSVALGSGTGRYLRDSNSNPYKLGSSNGGSAVTLSGENFVIVGDRGTLKG